MKTENALILGGALLAGTYFLGKGIERFGANIGVGIANFNLPNITLPNINLPDINVGVPDVGGMIANALNPLDAQAWAKTNLGDWAQGKINEYQYESWLTSKGLTRPTNIVAGTQSFRPVGGW